MKKIAGGTRYPTKNCKNIFITFKISISNQNHKQIGKPWLQRWAEAVLNGNNNILRCFETSTNRQTGKKLGATALFFGLEQEQQVCMESNAQRHTDKRTDRPTTRDIKQTQMFRLLLQHMKVIRLMYIHMYICYTHIIAMYNNTSANFKYQLDSPLFHSAGISIGDI